jgi:methylated-DNA-protein-cysteine methyltransferase related protein
MHTSEKSESFFHRVRVIVESIPRGKVVTYGQVAALAGNPRGARMVGWALASMPNHVHVPWQRVINAQGRISFPEDSDTHRRQRTMLETEGVQFGKTGRVDMARYQWQPDSFD